MYLYHCSDPDCRGHIKAWERCSDVKAFAATHEGCRSCSEPAATCLTCPGSAASGLYSFGLLSAGVA
ncbi:hypothetical protein dsx2_1308 [Desulfovibrio sp. X2]|uniref:hypothetical protein n=1 Tax=Desulfovibrio sp. X2 TaxID=941449 RepID=UPI0003589486|nr:hypothetical protein [Desulfovibrio sp. X2]EPR44680.1 hypothetical protein dsx2_1308 [Desulfovibrio sp. X2]